MNFWVCVGVNTGWYGYRIRQTEVDELQKRVDAEVDQCHLGDMLDILDGKIVDEIEQALKGD